MRWVSLVNCSSAFLFSTVDTIVRFYRCVILAFQVYDLERHPLNVQQYCLRSLLLIYYRWKLDLRYTNNKKTGLSELPWGSSEFTKLKTTVNRSGKFKKYNSGIKFNIRNLRCQKLIFKKTAITIIESTSCIEVM